MTEIAGKVVWVTGASSGIGAAVASEAANRGARVILSGRRQEALEEVARALNGESMILPFEATDFEGLAGFVDRAWQWQGRVDVLINNAGVSQRSLALNTCPEVYRDLIDIDLLGPIWLTQLQLNRMVAAGGAHIVAISSVAGRIGAPLRTAYCAAKHGLIGYMDALRSEVDALYNIKVTNVLPGSVATNVSRNAFTGDGSQRGRSDDNIDNGDDPMDCARAILNAVEQNQPELMFAKDGELGLAKLRHDDPEAFFQAVSAFGVKITEEYAAESSS